jgi:anaerobic magnesium-protoporphyrin IX monomethyl ester cyclase
VLIQAPYIEDYGPMRKAAGVYYPLGIAYISSCAKEKGYDVHFIDPNVQTLSQNEIVEKVRRLNPVLVGVSFMTPQFFTAKTIVDSLKQGIPDVSIVLGGAHPSVLKEKTLEEIPSADFVVFGEGEETTVELLDDLMKERKSLDKINGLAWKQNGVIHCNEERPTISEIDQIPFPDRTLIDQSLYHQQSFLGFSKRTQSIYTTRGCPFRCVFCASGFKLTSQIRERSIDNVMEEIDFLRSQYDFNYLLIKDDVFTIRRSRVIEFCRALKERHPDLKWHCMANVNTVDAELLAIMKDAGLHDIFFGIESGNPEILKNTMKGTTVERVWEAVKSCDQLGIRTYGAFILGLPGENYNTLKETIEFACQLPLTLAGFSILIPYPGTKVYDDYLESLPNQTVDYRNFIASSGIHTVEEYRGADDIDSKDLPKYISLAQRRFYFRPRQVVRMLKGVNSSIAKGYFTGFMALASKETFLLRQKLFNHQHQTN